MKRRYVMAFLVLFLTVLTAWAAALEPSLPKGTRVEKTGPSLFQFRLPDGARIEVLIPDPKARFIAEWRSFDAQGKPTGNGKGARLVGIIDPVPPSVTLSPDVKFIVWRGRLFSLEKAVPVPPDNYVLIDDDITWLPARIVSNR